MVAYSYECTGWYSQQHTAVLVYMVFDRKRWNDDEGEELQLAAWPAVLEPSAQHRTVCCFVGMLLYITCTCVKMVNTDICYSTCEII